MSAGESSRGRALALFDVLADAPEQERGLALTELRQQDPAAAAYLERLLEADAAPSRLLGGGMDLLAADEAVTEIATYAPGQAIGPYRLRERLGRGGMGEVWTAERAGEGFAQVVALKLLPPELGAGTAAARFRRERRILATLEHPAIARFIDGGVSVEGVPFLAMERVEGAPIVRHLDERGASLEERLERFAEVCDVVAFAHRALVVHRDLKPSNVLVTPDGQVKLLDFGIAKLIQDDTNTAGSAARGLAAGEETFRTHLDERVMTPAYAAPEQIRGEVVTTATDVWALGVLLYEILTGERPFAAPGESRHELERQVLEVEPVRPSTRATRGQATTSGVVTKAAVGRRLRGDLDAIVLTALEKDPARRYRSVSALADDVRAFLAGRPVGARRAGVGERAAKFVRRHRLAVAAAAVAMVGIGAGLGVALWQAREAERAGRRAEEVKAFLLRLFEVTSPEESRGERVTARELLDEGARRVGELGGEPALQVELYQTLGGLYGELGLFDEARRLAAAGVPAAVRAFGEVSLEAFDARLLLAETMIVDDDLGEARRELERVDALAARLARRHPEAPLQARALGAKIAYEEGNPEEAVRLQREVVAGLAEGDPDALHDEQVDLADYVFATGDNREAERLQREILAAVASRHGELHPRTARARHNLGTTLGQIDRDVEAIAELERAVAIHRQVEGESHPDLAGSLHELAQLLTREGRYDQAAPIVEEAIAVARRARGEKSFLYGNQINDRGILASYDGRYADAVRDFQFVAASWLELLGPDHPSVLTVQSNLSSSLERLGRLDEAEAASRQVLAAVRRNSPEDSWLGPLNTLGIVLRQRGEAAEAAALHREAEAIALRTKGEGNSSSFARMNAARALVLAGNLPEAGVAAESALRVYLGVADPDSPGEALFHLAVAEVRMAQGRFEEALAAADRTLALRRKHVAETDPRMAEARLMRGAVLIALGRAAEARADVEAAAGVLGGAYGPEHPLVKRAQAARSRLG